MPKIAAPKAPQIDTHFIKSAAATAKPLPKISFAAVGRAIRRMYRFITAPKAAGQGKVKWYYISPRRFAMLAVIVALPEILLQTAAFCAWYYPTLDTSPSVLCIADFDTSYPDQVQQEMKKAKIEWKVIKEVHPAITVGMGQNIIDFYSKTRKPSIVYLSIGSSELRPRQINEHIVTWETGFEWKWRTPALSHLISNGTLKPALESNRFRYKTPEQKYSFLRLNILQSLSHTANASEPDSKAQSKPVATAPSVKQEPEVYDSLKLQSLLELPYQEQASEFPQGEWESPCFRLSFSNDGTAMIDDHQFQYVTDGSRLTLSAPRRQLEFWWRFEKDSLLLLSDFSPLTMVLKKVNSTPTSSRSRSTRLLDKAFFKVQADDTKSAEAILSQLPPGCLSDPAVAAIRARIHHQQGNQTKSREQIESLNANYKANPDQRTAESLFFSIASESNQQKIGLAVDLIERFPFSPFLWATLAEYAEAAGNQTTKIKARNRAIKLCPEYLRKTKAIILRHRRDDKYSGPSKIEQGSFMIKKWIDRRKEMEEITLKSESELEQVKQIEAQQTAVLNHVRELIRKYPSKQPQLVFVPNPNRPMLSRILMGVFQEEGKEIVSLNLMKSKIKSTVTAKMGNTAPLDRHDLPKNIDEFNRVLALLVMEHFQDRVQRARNY